ncbi:MAG: hypothetical protein IPH51_19595 [Rubrivivax sp.]|nr:hypothetical protein [Rubrivivax sp.]
MDASVLRKIIGDDEASVREFLALFRQTAQRQRAPRCTRPVPGRRAPVSGCRTQAEVVGRSIGAQALAGFVLKSKVPSRLETWHCCGNTWWHSMSNGAGKLTIDAYLGDGDGG